MVNYKNNYLNLEDLTIYQESKLLNNEIWKIYNMIDKEFKYTLGSQILRSGDSVGANIAEGYGRFHYLDKIKFYYNARGSLLETKYWVDTLEKRNIISENIAKSVIDHISKIHISLNSFIKKTLTEKSKFTNLPVCDSKQIN